MRLSITLSAAIAAVLGTACSRNPPSYPVPAERTASDSAEATPATQFVTMVARDADDFIVGGVFARRGRDPYRWTGPRIQLRFKIKEQRPLEFMTDLAVPEAGFRITGPVSIRFLVDGKDLGTLACPQPGRYRFAKEVPLEWTGAGSVVVTAIADPSFYYDRDRLRYGFLLFAAGLFTR